MKKIILVVCLVLFLSGVCHAEKSFCLNGIDDALAVRILLKTCKENTNCDPNSTTLAQKEKYLKIQLIDFIRNKVWEPENKDAESTALSTVEYNIAIPIDPNQ